MKRRIVLTVIALACALSLCAQVRHVKVGISQVPGYYEEGEDGRKSGYGYDFLNLVQRYSNIRFEYIDINCSYPQLLQKLRDGEIDLVTGVHKTPERLNDFNFTYSMGDDSGQLLALDGDDRFTPYDYKSFDGIVIGMVEGSVIEKRFEKVAHENHFTYKMKSYKDATELRKALSNREVDAVVSISLCKTPNHTILARFDTQNIYAITAKKNTSLQEEINQAIAQMDLTEGNWENTLHYNNYIKEDSDTQLVFTDEEMEYIKAHSVAENPIVMATDNEWKPFSMKRGSDYVGIIPDYWRHLLDMTGMKYSFYDCGDKVFPLSGLVEGKADIYLGTSYTPSIAEQKGLLVSTPFMNVGASLLFRKSYPDINKVALCEAVPFLNETFVAEEGWETVYYVNSDDAVKALAHGRVDAVYCYTYDAERLMNNDYTGFVTYKIVPGVSVDLRAVIPIEADHRLMSIMTKCINSLKGTEAEAIISNHLTYTASVFNLREWMTAHPWLTLLGVLVAIALVVWLVEATVRLRIRLSVNKEQAQHLKETTELNGQLERAIKEANRANQAKTAFLFNMSHDIRTPMNAIMGYIELMEKNGLEDKEKAKDYLDKIHLSSNFLLSLINNVLEMARIDSGKMELNEQPCLCQSLRREIGCVYADLMRKKNIDFRYTEELQTEAVYIDSTKLGEIFLNLISNAYKYTPSGGSIHISVKERPSAREGYMGVTAVFEDTGIGMSKEYLPKIFEEFSREQSFTDNKIHGTGLGLPIVKKLVELMNGNIEVESELGKGSKFTVTFECRKADANLLKSEQEQECDVDFDFSGKRILLAEDNELNAEIAVEILSSIGLDVEVAEDGTSCVEKFSKAPAGYFDLILMDVQMPNMNGYEATKAIREMEDAEKAGIPIIAMTANAFDEDRNNAIAAGMNGHLSKPIDMQALMKTLGEMMNTETKQS